MLAACGSSAGTAPSDPLSTELSYIPPASPVVATIVTDPNSAPVKDLSALLKKFQVASLLTSALQQELQKNGLSYDADIKPLLGNPVVVGGFQTAGGGSKLKGGRRLGDQGREHAERARDQVLERRQKDRLA